jgi:precorrin-3B methylase
MSWLSCSDQIQNVDNHKERIRLIKKSKLVMLLFQQKFNSRTTKFTLMIKFMIRERSIRFWMEFQKKMLELWVSQNQDRLI